MERIYYLPDGSQEVRLFDAAGRDLHIDQPLSNLLIDYRPQGFIGDRIFPVVPVGKQSDLYYRFDQGDLYRIPNTQRSPGTAPKRVAFNVSSETYYALNYALAYVLPIEDITNADSVLNLRQRGATFLTDLLALDMENRVGTIVLSGANVGTNATPASLWSNHKTGNSDPLTDIDTAIETVRQRTGYKPNRIAFSERAWRHFKRHEDIRTSIFPAAGGGAGPGVPTLAQVAALFDVDEVMVGGVVKNTAAEGLSQSLADVWGSNVLVYYAPAAPARDVPSLGYFFRWAVPGVPAFAVERIPYDARIKAEEVHVGYYQAEKITGVGFGYVITSVSAT